MPCKYFKYINIEAVYAELGSFTAASDHLGNIPLLFIDNVSSFFENLAIEIADEDDDDPISNAAPNELAAKVSQVLEECLEKMIAESGKALPEDEEEGLDRVFGIEFLALLESFHEDFLRKLVLVCFEYDTLCWLYDLEDWYSGFAMTEVISRSVGDLESCFARQAQEWERRKNASLDARERAIKRHAATNEQKSRLLKEWADSSSEYQSRADFCRIISQREGMLYRTLYDWIARHDRDKKTSH
ncbi:hypothetical protein FEA48_11095 [Pseudomonas nitroreducens]|uniref:Uncharacterized protein n=1 Tax=Pseudomonas nitroreducens TaxID=46680 RepID=A0A5R9A7N8_PSENT|nr:hypothetical protein [Pseudomonas nitroreducens]TLP74752.1 hypothetical protein FEA48_11095 [Pseudomonas nitroreducens]